MRNRPWLQMALMGLVGVAILLPIALVVPWFPTQASTQAHRVDTLYKVLLICSVPIFVLVETVVLYSVWKFRMRPGDELKDGPPIHGDTRLEVMWTAAPALLIIALCAYAYTVLHANEAKKPNTITVNVIGEQFAWYFAYPQADGKAVVTQQLNLPKDQPVVFQMHSRDVIHGFWVPAFREKLDVVPGITTTLRVTPNRLGTFPIVCSQLCGNGHALMRAPIHVMEPAAFRTWLSRMPRQAAPAYSFNAPASSASTASAPAAGSPAPATGSTGTTTTASAGGSAAQGKTIFTGTGGCGACHTLADAGTSGTVGPNLGTALVADAKRRGLPLQAFIQESIVKPNAYISPGFPSGVMPQSFGQSLTPAQIQSLVAYLASVTK